MGKRQEPKGVAERGKVFGGRGSEAGLGAGGGPLSGVRKPGEGQAGCNTLVALQQHGPGKCNLMYYKEKVSAA